MNFSSIVLYRPIKNKFGVEVYLARKKKMMELLIRRYLYVKCVIVT